MAETSQLAKEREPDTHLSTHTEFDNFDPPLNDWGFVAL